MALHCLHAAQRAETSAKSVRPSSTLQSSPSHLSSTPLTNRAEERHDDSDAAPATSVYGDEWLPHAVAFARVDEVGTHTTRSRKRRLSE